MTEEEGTPEPTVIFRPARHYVCAQCMATGVPDQTYTSIDDRYTLGYCMGDHKGNRQTLVREDIAFRQRQKKEQPTR